MDSRAVPGHRPADDLLGFVRGDHPLAVLENLGVTVQTSHQLAATFPSGLPAVSPSLGDLATGILKVLPDAHAGRVWAFVVLASDVELPDPEQSDAADALLSAIWDLSVGDEPLTETLTLIQALADAPGTSTDFPG